MDSVQKKTDDPDTEHRALIAEKIERGLADIKAGRVHDAEDVWGDLGIK